jgi:hypothetical protein
MDALDDPRDNEVSRALRRTADVPLGLTARLEVSVVRRARAEVRFTSAEKWCLASGAVMPMLAGGVGGGVLLLLAGGAVVVGYLQWTVLVEEGPQG